MIRSTKISFVNEISLIGKPVYFKRTFPASAYVESLSEFSINESWYIAEYVFDILGSESDICASNSKIGEIHGYLLNNDRMERDGFSARKQYCDGDDICDIYWRMQEGHLGNNKKSKNIFYIDKIIVFKEHRYNKIGTLSVLMIPTVLDEQFNANIGYLISKSLPILDNEKIQKEDIELYKRLCDNFWDRLGFSTSEDFRYYNMSNNLLEENSKRLSSLQCTEICFDIREYCCCCDVKILGDSREIHIMEYADIPYCLKDGDFPILQEMVRKKFNLNGIAEEWKWIFYNYLGKTREFKLSQFGTSSVRDDSYYARMLNYYGYFIEQV